jgi:hypothetical protein
MRTLFDGEQRVDHSQFFLSGLGRSMTSGESCFVEQRNGLCGSRVAGGLFLRSGLYMGEVELRIEVHDTAPSFDDSWEEIAESCSCRYRS